jgi:MFS family permease
VIEGSGSADLISQGGIPRQPGVVVGCTLGPILNARSWGLWFQRRIRVTGVGMHSIHRPYERWRVAALGLIALLVLMPVTLPVPILRTLVQARFEVSEFLTSIFMSINMVGALLAAPLAGALTDRFGRRREMIVGALLVDALCFVGLTRDVSFGVFLGIRFIEGSAHIFALSLLLALASTSQTEEKRGRAMGVVGAGLLLGVALGAPLGGALGRNGPFVPLYAGAVIVALAAAAAAAVLRETGGERQQRPSIAEIAATVSAHRQIMVPLVFAFADRFTVGFYASTLTLYLTRIHSAEPQTVGLLIASFMLPFAILSYPFGTLSERRSRALMLCVGSFFYGVGTASIGFTPPEVLRFTMPLIGASAAVMFVPSMVMTTDLVPEEVRATALGAFNAAGSLGFIVGPAAGGFISQAVATSHGWQTGYHAAFVAAGLSEILCVVLALPFLRRLVATGRTT